MVILYLCLKATPLPARLAIIKKEMRTVLVWRIHPITRPVIMRDNLRKRDAVFIHQVGSQFGSPVNGPDPAVPPVLAHFDSNRIFVPGAVEISMPPRHVGWQVLHRHVLVGSVVP